MIINAADPDPTSAYKLLIGIIIPRAIGWVSTLSVDGVANLAPISFFTGVGRKPPMVSVRFSHVQWRDVEGHFHQYSRHRRVVTNLVTLPQAHEMHRTAFEFPPEVDEFEAIGLKRRPA